MGARAQASPETGLRTLANSRGVSAPCETGKLGIRGARIPSARAALGRRSPLAALAATKGRKQMPRGGPRGGHRLGPLCDVPSWAAGVGKLSNSPRA
eukprot:8725689-Alexandrium_andersonii.AAC.1